MVDTRFARVGASKPRFVYGGVCVMMCCALGVSLRGCDASVSITLASIGAEA